MVPRKNADATSTRCPWLFPLGLSLLLLDVRAYDSYNDRNYHHNGGGNNNDRDHDDRYKLMLLMDGNQDDDALCACIDEAKVGETVRLCDCVKYDYGSAESKWQQWILTTSPLREQQWRPRKANNLCVCPDHGTLRLFECSDNQQAFWIYDEDDDEHMCTFQSGDVCASPSASGRRERDLGIGFGTRGQGEISGAGRYDATGDNYASTASTSITSRADPLVLAPRSRSYSFKLIDVGGYDKDQKPSNHHQSYGYKQSYQHHDKYNYNKEKEFQMYCLDDGNLCIGYDDNRAGEYLKAVKCRWGDESQQWKLQNGRNLWESKVLQDPEDSRTTLCVRRDGDGYLRLAYCDSISDEWTYGEKLRRAIAPYGKPRKCVTFHPDKHHRSLQRMGFGTRGGGYTGGGGGYDDNGNSESAGDGDPLRLSLINCEDLEEENYQWYIRDPEY